MSKIDQLNVKVGSGTATTYDIDVAPNNRTDAVPATTGGSNANKLIEADAVRKALNSEKYGLNVNILKGSGGTPHAAYANADAARIDVDASYRALGLKITYLLTDDKWYTDQFIGTAVDNTSWNNSANWQVLGPVSVSQNTSTGHTDITIGSTTIPVASVEEVSQLGQDVRTGIFNLDGYIDTNGNVISSETRKHTGYINITLFSEFKVKGGSNIYGVALIAFYDKNKAYIANSSLSGNGYDNTWITIPKTNFPENAVYVRCSSNTSGEGYLISDDATIVSALNIALNAINEAGKVQDNVDKLVGYEFNQSGYIDATAGYIEPSQTRKCTDYIGIKAFREIKVKGGSNIYGCALLAYYDANKKFINSLSGNSYDNREITISSIDFPLGAAFIRCSSNSSGEGYFKADTSIQTAINASSSLTKLCDGKKVILFGDSQLAQARDYPSYSTAVEKLLQQIVGGKVYNWSVGGCSMALRETPSPWDAFSMVSLADALTTGNYSEQESAIESLGAETPPYVQAVMSEMQAENLGDGENVIICIAYGGNDFNNLCKLGQEDSSIKTEFRGAINYSVSTLLKAFPLAKICLIGTSYRVFTYTSKTPEGITSDSDDYYNIVVEDGENKHYYRYTYNDVIVSQAKILHVAGYDKYFRAGRNKWDVWELCPYDGLHPESLGGRKAEAEYYASVLRSC